MIPLATQHYMLPQRNLIYTGITRGKRLLVLIGQKKELGIAVRNDRASLEVRGARGKCLRIENRNNASWLLLSSCPRTHTFKAPQQKTKQRGLNGSSYDGVKHASA